MHTNLKLSRELRLIGLDEMADKATEGYYHDFLSPLPAPCLQLAADLAAVGTPEALALRSRHLDGEFDATKEESEEWMDSKDGRETLGMLFGSKPMKGQATMRKLIRTDGSEQLLVEGPLTIAKVEELIHADTLDTVALRHLGAPLLVMFVDDKGHDKGLPVNAEATRLYWANCKPGTTHPIVGDVVMCPDDDFAQPM